MNRTSIAFCVSASAVAVALSSFTLLNTTSIGVERQVVSRGELRDLVRHIENLSERIDALEARPSTRPADTMPVPLGVPEAPRRAPPSAQPPEIEERLAALTQRLAALEDEETIARLAQSGEDQLKERELQTALAHIRDPASSPEDRLAALHSLRRLSKTSGAAVKIAMAESDLSERDLLLPLLEAAQDISLEPEFRAEVVRSLESKLPDLRQPLLELLAFDEAPVVREETVHALMYHLGDADVRQAIRQASQSDPAEPVRQRATLYLPKVQYFDDLAAEGTEGRARPGPRAKTAPRGEAK